MRSPHRQSIILFLWTVLSRELPVIAPAQSQLPLTCSPFTKGQKLPRMSQHTFGPHWSGFTGFVR